MTQDEIIEMAKLAGFGLRYEGRGQILSAPTTTEKLESFAKLVAEKAISKDREEFDIDELCARQNKIGYKQGYRAGQLAEREACAKVCEAEWSTFPEQRHGYELAALIRARGEA